MGNVFETCSISKKASRNISEPELLQDTRMREKVIEPETALETHTGNSQETPNPNFGDRSN